MITILTVNNKTREMTAPTARPFLFVCTAAYRYSGSISAMLQGNKKNELFQTFNKHQAFPPAPQRLCEFTE